jgi:hypothetical protein
MNNRAFGTPLAPRPTSCGATEAVESVVITSGRRGTHAPGPSTALDALPDPHGDASSDAVVASRGTVLHLVPRSEHPGAAVSIIHLVDRVERGRGRSISALAIAEAQHRAGWDVRLLVSGVRSPELLPAEPRHEPLLGDCTADVYRTVPAIGRVAAALERMTTAGDTIVSHDGIHLAASCRLGDRRVVAAVHSNPLDCLAYLPAAELNAITQRTHRWVAWGRPVAAQLIASLRIDPTRITVSAQAVDPGRDSGHSMCGSPACLSVARIHPVKNQSLMLETLAVLARSLPSVHWHMVGGCEDPAYGRGLGRLATGLGVSHRVTWHGYRHDVSAIMLGCDVTVLASHSEGVPRAIQEAMILGVPTVMPAALARDVSHAGLPITYDQQEPHALAGAIRTALHVDARQLGAAARWVARRWGWDAVLNDWERVVSGR